MTRILVVDDNPDMLELVKNVLRTQSYLVDCCLSPAQINQRKLASYDLILLDIMMPDLDGISYCKQIRSMVDCPILFLTAKSLESDIVEGLVSGGDDYITKPFGMNELLARVQAHLRREKRERHSSLHLGNIRFDLSANEIYVKDIKMSFTKSEYQISELLAKRRWFSDSMGLDLLPPFRSILRISEQSSNSLVSLRLRLYGGLDINGNKS